MSASHASSRRSSYTSGSLYRGTEAGRRGRVRFASPALLAALAAVILSGIGVSVISLTRPELASRQAAFLLVGVAAAVLTTLVPPRSLRVLCWPLAIVSLALLVFVLLPFVPRSIVTPRNGARAWIDLGVVDFQPSELAKIAFILCLAQWLSLRGSPRTLAALAASVVLMLVPVGLIVLEPDLGSALLFFPTCLAMLIAAGARLRHVVPALVGIALLAPVAYFGVLKPYQRARIDAIVAQVKGDTRFERDIGFQGWRAMRLVGAGGIAGHDAEHARALIRHNALPEEHNDMVFAVVACRYGLVGGIGVLLLHGMLGASALATGLFARDGFSKLAAIGFGALLFAQTCVNVGMTIGLLPITGVTLPFVSYGGSSLVASWVLIGLLVGIGVRPPLGGEKDPFDVS
jgi:cell division protein FtsW (lipid II flippase)